MFPEQMQPPYLTGLHSVHLPKRKSPEGSDGVELQHSSWGAKDALCSSAQDGSPGHTMAFHVPGPLHTLLPHLLSQSLVPHNLGPGSPPPTMGLVSRVWLTYEALAQSLVLCLPLHLYPVSLEGGDCCSMH